MFYLYRKYKNNISNYQYYITLEAPHYNGDSLFINLKPPQIYRHKYLSIN